MFQIVVLPTNTPAAAGLFYRSREKAETALLNIQDMQDGKIEAITLKQKDDFGNILSIPIANVSYALFVDLVKQAELQQYGAKKN